jgi:hypothetical protein
MGSPMCKGFSENMQNRRLGRSAPADDASVVNRCLHPLMRLPYPLGIANNNGL